MKTKYQATFADGEIITRTSDRVYTVAWRATWVSGADDKRVGDKHDKGNQRQYTGFAKDRESAIPFKPTVAYAGRHLSSNERSKALRENAEYLVECGYKVEFAEVEIVN